MFKKLDIFAGELYIEIICATNYREQEPAYTGAKWYDLFWLLVPIFGIMPFTESIKQRYQQRGPS